MSNPEANAIEESSAARNGQVREWTTADVVPTAATTTAEGGGEETTRALLEVAEKGTVTNESSDGLRTCLDCLYGCVKPVEGYLLAIAYAFCMCSMHVLVKMAPDLDGSNHSLVRYLIQLATMLALVKWHRLDVWGPRAQRPLLLARGLVGSTAVLLGFFSLRYLDVSDVETLTNSGVVLTAILARLVLHEKFTPCHLVALPLTVVGVVFIMRPSFLFGIEINMKDIFVKPPTHLHVNVTNATSWSGNASQMLHHNRSTRSLIDKEKAHIKDHSNREFTESIIGVVLVLGCALCQSAAQVIIRKLCLVHVHHAISALYPAMVGLPISLVVSALFYKFKFIEYATLEDDAATTLATQLGYSVLAGVMGTLGLVFLNLALKFEDPTKVGMIKTNVGIFFAFMLQYVVLDIEVDSLGFLGALFVITATVSVLLLKLFDRRLVDSKNPLLRFLTKKI